MTTLDRGGALAPCPVIPGRTHLRSLGRCALLRASKDEHGPWPTLRGSLRSHLRMTGARSSNPKPSCSRRLRTLSLDRLVGAADGVRWVHRIVLGLIGIDECCEHIETVAVARSRLRAPEALDLFECGLIIPLRPDRLYLPRHAAPPSHRSCRS